MANQQRETIRYSISFKQKVVREVEEGLGIWDARRRYGIKGSHTVQRWISRFGKNHLLNKTVRIEMKGGKRSGKGTGGPAQKAQDSTGRCHSGQCCLGDPDRGGQRALSYGYKKKFRRSAIQRTAEQKGQPIKELCRYFNYSRSGYYKSLETDTKAILEEEVVITMTLEQRRDQPKVGGKKLYWLLKGDLQKLDQSIGRDKFFDILRKHCLLVKRKRKYVRTTESWHFYHKYKNMLKNKVLTKAHQAYVSDITYLRTAEGFKYLFLQTDAYSRMITGWHVSDNLSIEGAIKALKMSLKQCPDARGRDLQYQASAFVTELMHPTTGTYGCLNAVIAKT